MKKVLLQIILLVSFFPFIVNAETCDINKITIDSVTIKKKTNNVTELEPPIIEGKKIKVNLRMLEAGDSIKYKLLLKNDSEEDYALDNNILDSSSNYIEYNLESGDNNLIVKSGEAKEVYLRVQYKNAVPETSFQDGKYNDNKSLALNLSTNNLNTTNNPKTSNQFFIMLIITLLCFSIFIYFHTKKKESNLFLFLLLGFLITIPSSVYALCKIEITVESNVTIEKGYEVGYLITTDGFYTDEELASYQKTSQANCDVVYIGETKYNVCSYIIVKDDKKYVAGEKVNLKNIVIRKYNTGYYDETNDEWIELCGANQDGLYQCPETIEVNDDTINTWYYDSSWNRYGYDYDTTDMQIMNFNTYNYDKNDHFYYVINVPQTFTMPAHNVLFASKPAPGK